MTFVRFSVLYDDDQNFFVQLLAIITYYIYAKCPIKIANVWPFDIFIKYAIHQIYDM